MKVTENKPLAFDLSATDSEGNVLNYVAQDPATLPAGATFTDNIFIWRLWYNQAGSYEITFDVPGQPDLTQSVPMVVENVTPTPVRTCRTFWTCWGWCFWTPGEPWG